ncbi:unnamed protein product [Rhizophagus irregularis]|uniref:Uncharacterized protein n=1 Tax=Rhizophagus irregularis TaxID=588596 RepID=A0A2I1G8X0_9GLOM|nr:hypothetical protein RhiirA4_442340 [Rhizophagus irregularis]CAB4408719.1 unnamed protein product [Rhizophagus irregularis]CAB4409733.1 unnamed protein product [Rhizophagus irregularis]
MSSSNSFTPFDHSDDQQPTKPIVNNISNFDDNIIPNSSELDSDMLSNDNISQQNSDSIINAGTSTTDTTTTSKKVFKKKPTVDPNYILFGYIPNYKIPIVNIPISYPLDVISDKVRYITSKFGFGEKGIAKKSIASRLQSFIYGGNIPKKSVFSYIQSFSSYKKTVEKKDVVESTSQQQ